MEYETWKECGQGAMWREELEAVSMKTIISFFHKGVQRIRVVLEKDAGSKIHFVETRNGTIFACFWGWFSRVRTKDAMERRYLEGWSWVYDRGGI